MFSFLHRVNVGGTSGGGSEKLEDADSSIVSTWMNEIASAQVCSGDMNALVMDYLVTEGYKEAAERFRTEASVEPSVPLDSLDSRIRVCDAIQDGKVDEAVDLTNEMNSEILDNKPHLFFHLQQQKLIELIRKEDVDGALEFAQNTLAELGTDNCEFLEELEQTMALLAYSEPSKSPFGNLMDPAAQRRSVAAEMNVAILESDHEDTTPRLANVVKLLLWTQNELDKKRIKYPKMVDLSNAKIKQSSEDKNTTITIT